MTRLLAHLLIRAYQLTASSVVGRRCRYLPTCSEYMDEAISRHGLWVGGWMGTARLCRCHPWGGSGYDPVGARDPSASWLRPWCHGRWRFEAPGQDDARRARLLKSGPRVPP